MQAINKFIITGVAGKIGNSLAKDKRVKNLVGIYHEEKPENLKKGKYFKMDLARSLEIPKNQRKTFDFLVHTAAKTHIDRCEKDRKNGKHGKVWKSNVVATKRVLNFCNKYNKKLIYLSTECVFDGKKKSYKEKDKPNPINWYGETKYKAEKMIVKSGLDYLIIRAVMAYGHGKRLDDIVQIMQNKLKIDGELTSVNNQRMNPTLTQDIIDSIFALLEQEVNGIYHVSGSTVVTPYELAKKIANRMGIDENYVKGIPLEDYFIEGREKFRLKNSVLDTTKYEKRTGLATKGIDEGLKIVFQKNFKY